MCSGIARAGNGVCLMTATAEGIIAKTSKLVKAAKTEFLEDIAIDWGTPSQSLFFVRWRRASQGSMLQQGPRALPLLYGCVRLVVFSIVKHSRFKIPNEVIIQAKRASTGEIVKFAVAVTQLDRSTSDPQTGFIHTLAARRIIMDLEDRERGVISPSTKTAIIKLGQHYQLASRFTSFIAVEGQNQKKLGAAPLPHKLSGRKTIKKHIQVVAAAPMGFVESYDKYLGGEEYGVSRSRPGPPPAPFIPAWEPSITTSKQEYVASRHPSQSSRVERVPRGPAAVTEKIPSSYRLPPLDLAPAAASNSDPVEQLVRLQSFEGAFSPSTEFVAIFGRDAVAAGRRQQLDERVWATVLAIAYLRKHLAHEPELLEGLVEKAMGFLNHAHVNDLQSLLDTAGDLIP